MHCHLIHAEIRLSDIMIKMKDFVDIVSHLSIYVVWAYIAFNPLSYKK